MAQVISHHTGVVQGATVYYYVRPDNTSTARAFIREQRSDWARILALKCKTACTAFISPLDGYQGRT